MIWRNQNNGPDQEDRGEPPVELRPSAADAVNSRSEMGSVGERVETVLEAAERAAADIRKDAEQWAQRHMEETRRRADELAAQRLRELSSITDDLLKRAQAFARQSDELIGGLDGASRRAPRVPSRRQDDPGSNLGPNSNSNSSSNSGGAQSGPKARESTNGSVSSGSSERRPVGPISDGARLLVTQMAVAGSSRETIASRLQEEFGIVDPGAMLDEAGL
jgi:hypothetical protein